MEIFKNRYGVDRVYEKISPTQIRVMGESEFSRGSQDDDGNQTMFDFEGGPCLNVGGVITYGKMKWKIKSITNEKINQPNLCSVLCEVEMK